MSFSTSPRRRLRVLFCALAAAALATMAATAAGASAAPATGDVTLTLKMGAKSNLLREGVKVSPRSGNEKTQRVKLPVTDLDLSTNTVLTSETLTLRANGKSVKLRNLQLEAGVKSTAISAQHGGERKVLFRVQGSRQTIGTALNVNGPLTLTGNGVKALRNGLDLNGVTGGKLGSAKLSASLSAIVPVVPEPPKAPEEPKVDPYPYASQCPVGAVSGAPSGDVPGPVDGIAPAPLFSGTEQAVTGTEIDWGFLASFRGYVLTAPPAGSLQALEGSSASAEGIAMAAPSAFFAFPVGSGSYEAGTEIDHSDDKLVSDGNGTALFCKSGHGFSIAIKNPTVTIDGDDSRITADVGANFNGTWYPFQRVDIAELDLTGVEPTLSDGGNTIVWEDVPATLTEDGVTATGLGGFYAAGEPLDPVTVKTSLDRPLTQACTIDAGTGAPAAVSFSTDPLPTLTTPVVRTGTNIGTINWGFRRATRSTTFSGSNGTGQSPFQLLGGASESFPGAMGGGNSLPPTGGIGKFFRFPVSSYQYEAGEAGGADDRLIATSDATVGFCNLNFGAFGLIISKPTLVIDGANSRIVANAYSFAGSFMGGPSSGWTGGGRVTLVDLDTSAVPATTGTGTVRWGEANPDWEPIVNGIPVEGGLQTEAFSKATLTIASTASGGFDPVAAQIVLPAP
jgi:hypothetical protein